MLSLYDPAVSLALVPGAVVTALRSIDRGAGSELLYRNQVPELLTSLAERARGESITASNALEGVVASPRRAVGIIRNSVAAPRSRSEQQLVGYREALDYLFTDDWRPLNMGLLLHVHRLLWSRTDTPGGRFKDHDNVVVDRSPDGQVNIRFRPVAAAEVEHYVSELIARFQHEAAVQRHHPVLLIGLFVLDLTIIHPFADGNGRVARLMTNALLADAGYDVGRWISLEHLVAEQADGYYESLRASTTGWHDGAANPWPWLEYFVGIVALAYDRFTRRAAAAPPMGSKQQRVREYILTQAAPVFRLEDLRSALPGISDNTFRLVLATLRGEGHVLADGAGRSATWRRSTS